MKQSFKCLFFPWQLSEGLGMTPLCSSSRTLGPFEVLAPFLPGDGSVCAYICDSHFCMPLVSGLQYLGTGCWKRHFQFVWGFFTNYRSLLFTWYVCLLVSFPCLLLGEGGVLIRVEMTAGSWPLPPLHGLLRAGWMACYFTEFPNILAGIIFSADQETDSTRLWFAQQYIAARGVSNHYCCCSAGIGCELLAITVLFQIFFSNYFWTCSSNLKGKGTDLSQMLSRICSFCSSTHSVALLCQSGGT